MIEIVDAQSTDLPGILDLQSRNLKYAISENEMREEGFVTVEHNLDLLQAMNYPYPHTIAKVEDRVVGYALSMQIKFRSRIELLEELFKHLEGLDNYIVMGQVCIEKQYRGQGVFRLMYQRMAEKLAPHFDSIITEVSLENPRSLNAHLHVGFEIFKKREGWAIVWMPLRK